MPKPLLARLRTHSTTLHYAKGQIVFAPEPDPDTVFLLEKGIVRIYRLSPDGDEFTLAYISVGEIFGELTAFTNRPRESFAQAVVASTALCVPRPVFMEIVQATPQIGFSITKQIANRFERIETRAEALVFRSVAARLAGVLVMLLDDFGEVHDNQASLTLHLTQAEFATLVGAARPTVNQAFQQLRQAGLASFARGRVSISDVQKLRDFARDGT
ncbi:MAG: Crp/Fnr family transcriptional regulator [Paracoccus sp. (in: a-proteobacteria)]|uniref:Crp/Fnr family transcriptional regulator n=1 Tax=Paracoccus sp. TaxID=267 RepID=UPI0026E062F4|nr:Crp/Fnr family transcriptional regulator [Paracoccus sp. (in: a-proteobacteria)]MDO5632647.1 Crp/Fnr family transcriptional regulator [Paracoccus sp. (in: a-proteobacteria)]